MRTFADLYIFGSSLGSGIIMSYVDVHFQPYDDQPPTYAPVNSSPCPLARDKAIPAPPHPPFKLGVNSQYKVQRNRDITTSELSGVAACDYFESAGELAGLTDCQSNLLLRYRENNRPS
ncbi:hypothetical protein CIB48_g10170 [Xylaria polymorpha]|nr:hypothetical protein CIB48_g10170 [Xylaria polymorpha]